MLVPSFGSRGARPPVVVVVVVVVVLSSSLAFWNLDSLQSACSHCLAFSVRRRKTKKKKTKVVVVVVIKVKSIHCPRPPFPPSRYTFPPPPTQLLGDALTTRLVFSFVFSSVLLQKGTSHTELCKRPKRPGGVLFKNQIRLVPAPRPGEREARGVGDRKNGRGTPAQGSRAAGEEGEP